MASTSVDADAGVARDMAWVQRRFAEIVGVDYVDIRQSRSGLEPWWYLVVGAKAPVYDYARSQLHDELPGTSELYGRIGVVEEGGLGRGTLGLEARVLQAAIGRSLSVKREMLTGARGAPLHVPFGSGADTAILQPVNHAIWGRRGVGKSSLILEACRRLRERHDPHAWIGGQSFSGQAAPVVVAEIIEDALKELAHSATLAGLGGVEYLSSCVELATAGAANVQDVPDLHRMVRPINKALRAFFEQTGRHSYVFIDDLHLVHRELQAALVGVLLQVASGAGCVVNIAGVRSLVDLSHPANPFRIQMPDDLQPIALDRTLENPADARSHLESVLLTFMKHCGYRAISQLMRPDAIERLVWCSAGVPRDFLYVLASAIGYSREREREKVGTEMVNRAAGDLHDEKIGRLDGEAPQDAAVLRAALARLERWLLQEHRTNCFLVPATAADPGQDVLQKLVDLRLVHLVHSSVTPRKAGDKHRAYLLDYSFYTGVRRMQRLQELKTETNKKPGYEAFRNLPRLDPASLLEAATE